MNTLEENRHLIDGAKEAIKNGPVFITNCDLVVTMNWNKSFTDKMWEVKEHYENGGEIYNRP